MCPGITGEAKRGASSVMAPKKVLLAQAAEAAEAGVWSDGHRGVTGYFWWSNKWSQGTGNKWGGSREQFLNSFNLNHERSNGSS